MHYCRINQQWWLHWILTSWYSWYMYLHLIFLIMTGVYKSRKTSLWMYLRFMITLVIQLQSRCQQPSSSLAVIQWVSSTVSPKRLYLNGPWMCQQVLAVELLSDLGEHTHLSETLEEKLKRFVQMNVLMNDSNECSNLLHLTVQKQPPEVFCNKRCF